MSLSRDRLGDKGLLLPFPIVNNQPHRIGAASELSRKLDICEVGSGFEASNLTHLFPIKQRVVALTRRVVASALRFLVIHVGLGCAKKQMVRVDAARLVALVQNPKRRQSASVNQVGSSVSANLSFTMRSDSTNRHQPVRLLNGSNGPHPALAKLRSVCRDWTVFVNALPEATFKRIGESLRKAGMLLKWYRHNQNSLLVVFTLPDLQSRGHFTYFRLISTK